MLQLYKGYNIPTTARITKKLTEQYIGPFRIVKKISCLAYKLDVSSNWRIYLVFSVAQLKPTPPLAKNFFTRFFPSNLLFVFVKSDTHKLKNFEIEKFLNKHQIKKNKGRAIEYLVCQKGYGLKQDRWYNIKELNNATALVNDYKASLASTRTYFINGNIDFFFQ